jgi:hypothetical protein
MMVSRALQTQYIYKNSKTLSTLYYLALLHSVPPWLVWAEIQCTVHVGGRHLVDIIGDFSWIKGVTSRGHFW